MSTSSSTSSQAAQVEPEPDDVDRSGDVIEGFHLLRLLRKRFVQLRALLAFRSPLISVPTSQNDLSAIVAIEMRGGTNARPSDRSLETHAELSNVPVLDDTGGSNSDPRTIHPNITVGDDGVQRERMDDAIDEDGVVQTGPTQECESHSTALSIATRSTEATRPTNKSRRSNSISLMFGALGIVVTALVFYPQYKVAVQANELALAESCRSHPVRILGNCQPAKLTVEQNNSFLQSLDTCQAARRKGDFDISRRWIPSFHSIQDLVLAQLFADFDLPPTPLCWFIGTCHFICFRTCGFCLATFTFDRGRWCTPSLVKDDRLFIFHPPEMPHAFRYIIRALLFYSCIHQTSRDAYPHYFGALFPIYFICVIFTLSNLTIMTKDYQRQISIPARVLLYMNTWELNMLLWGAYVNYMCRRDHLFTRLFRDELENASKLGVTWVGGVSGEFMCKGAVVLMNYLGRRVK
ncbi:uncharacterized protein PAC_15659 [Phialocephala subalpina]|uniref:Uncharacterized protein n=1 Tax=Phialocephala subalpina TaxID=576137 RepID=A0A1L7XL42_9HELO|nr:uncharacterized protein PAC_15659 [Phialocephala subalpina]